MDRLDQNISCYMVHLRSKKWWWLFLRLWIDVGINNAFQLYRLRKLDAGQLRMNALEFRQAIVEAFYNLHRNERPSTALPGARATGCEHVWRNKANHWIAYRQQRRCARKRCKGTSVVYCELRNVGLHPHCFKTYHFEWHVNVLLLLLLTLNLLTLFLVL